MPCLWNGCGIVKTPVIFIHITGQDSLMEERWSTWWERGWTFYFAARTSLVYWFCLGFFLYRDGNFSLVCVSVCVGGSEERGDSLGTPVSFPSPKPWYQHSRLNGFCLGYTLYLPPPLLLQKDFSSGRSMKVECWNTCHPYRHSSMAF